VNWLLDTCVLSEPARKAPNPKVAQWLMEQSEEELFISVLTLGELWKGAALLPDGRKRRQILSWLQRDIRQRFEGRILPVDEAVSLAWGQLVADAGRPLPAIDSLIAATAVAHQLTVATRNTENMADTGAAVFDPWQG
jgi:predicted nucleic acid-binding protein